MTDIDEIDSGGSSVGVNNTDSIRASIINTPKDFPSINPSGKNDLEESMSNMSQFDQNAHYLRALMMREGDDAMDISVSSVCATPRNLHALGLDPDMS